MAWDLGRDDWRTFRLDRLSPRTPTGSPFAPRPVPTGDVATFVAARAKGSRDEDRWPCYGQFEIALPVRDLAPWVVDGHIEAITEHSSRVTAGSWSWAGLVADILRFDAPFRIIRPDALVAAANLLAARLRATHGEEPPAIPRSR